MQYCINYVKHGHPFLYATQIQTGSRLIFSGYIPQRIYQQQFRITCMIYRQRFIIYQQHPPILFASYTITYQTHIARFSFLSNLYNIHYMYDRIKYITTHLLSIKLPKCHSRPPLCAAGKSNYQLQCSGCDICKVKLYQRT